MLQSQKKEFMNRIIFFILLFPIISNAQEPPPETEEQIPYITMNLNVSNIHDAKSANTTNATNEKSAEKAPIIITVTQNQSSGISHFLYSLFSARAQSSKIVSSHSN